MINRYRSRSIFKNDNEFYKNVFRERNLKFIKHYETPNFSSFDENTYDNLSIIEHIWKEGDRYYKLAEKYYGDPRDWWVIAKFNSKPTESHLQVGDIVKIPTPLEKVLNYITG